jgi:hypothetical protein
MSEKSYVHRRATQVVKALSINVVFSQERPDRRDVATVDGQVERSKPINLTPAVEMMDLIEEIEKLVHGLGSLGQILPELVNESC